MSRADERGRRRPIVEAFGLDWSAQMQRIRRHPVLSKGVVVMTTPSGGGDQDRIGLRLTRSDFYLATVRPTNPAPRAPDTASLRYPSI